MESGTRRASSEDLHRIRLFNATDRSFRDDVTVHQVIEETVARIPDDTAVMCDHDKVFGATSLTFRQLNERANAVAHLLRAEGVRPDHAVGIMVERSFSMIVGILAILKAGGCYLPLSPDNPPDRTRYMLENSGAHVLLVQGKTAGTISFGGTVIDLDNPRAYEGSTHNPQVINTPRDLAYTLYTSGSTGKPNGVMIEHRSVVNRLSWMQNAYPLRPGDIILQKTPYYFDVSVWELFWWAFQGAQLCVLTPGGEKMPLLIVNAVKTHAASVLHFVPSMLNMFLEYLDGKDPKVVQNLASLRTVFCSGEALTPSHVTRFNDIIGGPTGARLINLYGPTEATVDVTHYACPPHHDVARVPIGTPIDNTRMYVMSGREYAAIGEVGELCIAGAGLARGYVNNPELTCERFTDNPANPGERIYHTGDLGRWMRDGNIEYLGREDFQVKIRGLRIELGEIENTLRTYPAIEDCVAVVKQYSETIILIVAYLVARRPFELDHLKRHLAASLPDYMVPNHFEMIDRVPLTSNGKADRKALPEPTLRGHVQ